MGETHPKRTVVRRRTPKAANSPEPSGPTGGSIYPNCGHDGCHASRCSVRYVGPTSSIANHHIMHAARGVTHIWSAAVITGLAIVITGALAFHAAQVEAAAKTDQSQLKMKQDLGREMYRMNLRLEEMQKALKTMGERCLPPTSTAVAE